MNKSQVIGHDGRPCPRCERPTDIYEHAEITKKHRKQPFYYSRWFVCTHKDCKTTNIMLEEFKVWNKNVAARKQKFVQKRWGRMGNPRLPKEDIEPEVQYRLDTIADQLKPPWE